MKRRGGVEVNYLLIFVLVAVSLIIGLFVLYNVGETIVPSRDFCEASILARASAPLGQRLPLECKPDKICFVASEKDNCRDFPVTQEVNKIVLDFPKDSKDGSYLVKEKEILNSIERTTANSLVDCWNIAGQGKLDIFSGDESIVGTALNSFDEIGSVKVSPKCIVCSRIAISDSVYEADKDLGILNKLDVNRYLAGHAVPGTSDSYLKALTDESLGAGYADFLSQEQNSGDKGKIASQIAILFLQIKVSNVDGNEAFWEKLKTNFMVGSVTALTPAGSIERSILGGGIYGWVSSTLLNTGISAAFAAKDVSDLKASRLVVSGTCGDMETNLEDKTGCSIVAPVEFSSDNLNKLCSGGIESDV